MPWKLQNIVTNTCKRMFWTLKCILAVYTNNDLHFYYSPMKWSNGVNNNNNSSSYRYTHNVIIIIDVHV